MKAINSIGRDDRQKQMIEDAALLADDADETSPLIGYVVLTFYGDGSTRSACYRPVPSDHNMGSTMFEAWAARTLESQFQYSEGVNAANNVLNGDA